MGYKKWSVTEGDAPGFGGVEGIAPMVISSVASALGAVVGVKLLGGLSEHARDRRRSRPNTPRQSVGDAASPAGAALPSKKPQIFKPRRRPRNAAHWSPDDSTTAVVTAAGATRPKVQLIANAATCAKVVDVALAAGAKPIMGATTPAEASETCNKVDATLLNFGTPTTEAIAAAVASASIVVVDPVGCGLDARGVNVKRWLDYRMNGKPNTIHTLVKGNASEMAALMRMYGLRNEEMKLCDAAGVTTSDTAENEVATNAAAAGRSFSPPSSPSKAVSKREAAREKAIRDEITILNCLKTLSDATDAYVVMTGDVDYGVPCAYHGDGRPWAIRRVLYTGSHTTAFAW